MRHGTGGLAALAALAIAPAGCAPASDNVRDSEAAPAASASGSPAGTVKARNPYSAKVLTDPQVLEQQRATADALRRSCEQTRQHCALAEGASRYLIEQGARR